MDFFTLEVSLRVISVIFHFHLLICSFNLFQINKRSWGRAKKRQRSSISWLTPINFLQLKKSIQLKIFGTDFAFSVEFFWLLKRKSQKITELVSYYFAACRQFMALFLFLRFIATLNSVEQRKSDE